MTGMTIGRRRVLSALGLGAAGVAASPLLAACGGNSGGVATGGGGGGGSKANLSQWYHQYGEKGTEQAAKKYAAGYKDANVTVQWTLGDYASKLSSRLVSGTGVDVFENNAADVASANAGRYADLTDIISPVKDSFNESALKTVTIGDKIYAVPMIIDPQMIYYRKSMLDKAGIKPPESIDDLVSAAKELTGGGKRGAFWGNDGGLALTMPMVWASGGSPLDDGHTKAAFATPATIKGAAALHQMYADKSILLGSPTDWTDPGAFIGGLVAMQWCGLWAMPTITAKWGDDVGILPMPAGVGGEPAIYVGGWNEYVAAKSSDVDASKAFVKSVWIDNSEDQTDWSLSYGFHIPPRKDVAAKADKLKSGLPAEAVKLTDDHAKSFSPYWTPAMNTNFTDAMTRIIQNGTDPAAQLNGAASKVTTAVGKLSS